jgi:hypothetical protein
MSLPDDSTHSNATAEMQLEKLLEDLRIAEENMITAQEKQERWSNTNRRDIAFSVGEKVLLSTSDLNLKGATTPKFTMKYIGPFEIKRVLSHLNYELSLPNTLPIHPVFHVSKLRKFVENNDTFVDRYQEPERPPPIVEEGNEEYEVESIRQHRIRRWKGEMHKQYLVKWKGYPEWENTWEWWDSLTHAKGVVDKYEEELAARKDKRD